MEGTAGTEKEALTGSAWGSGPSSDHEITVNHYNCAVALVHSKKYFWFNAVVLLSVLAMLIWIVVAPHHYTHNVMFVTLEIFVTLATYAALIIEMFYQGPREFFCRPVHPDATCGSKCKSFFMMLMNWSQVILLIASTIFVVYYFMGESAAEVVESEIVMGIFVSRYVLYVFFLLMVQNRAYDKQKYTYKDDNFEGGHDEWDIHFERQFSNTSDYLQRDVYDSWGRQDSLEAHLDSTQANDKDDDGNGHNEKVLDTETEEEEEEEEE